jgi:hypothetical protein
MSAAGPQDYVCELFFVGRYVEWSSASEPVYG